MSYTMTLDDYAWLRSPEGQEILSLLSRQPIQETDWLRTLTRLRAQYGKEHASAALELAQLRQKARSKFTRADEMYFTREALEQASGEVISRYRARRFAGCGRVAELGCGIGGDSIGLAGIAEVIGFERDELRLRLAEANIAAYGLQGRFTPICGDWRAQPLPAVGACFWDPSRRSEEERVFSIYRYDPPLTLLAELVRTVPETAVKISPGVRYEELAELGVAFELEFISERGVCKEAVLWCGRFQSAARRATLLPDEHTLTNDPALPPIAVGAPRRYLYEPDAAVIRAHLVEELAHQLGLTKLHSTIAYLTGDERIETPFAKAYRIEETWPFNLKLLKRRLRELEVGDLVVKKRGFAVEPEVFRKHLKLTGHEARVLFLTRVGEQPYMLIAALEDC